MWAFKKLSGSCLYYFLYVHFIREILSFSCSSRLKTARLFSGASPYGWCIIGSTLQALMLSLSHTHTEFFPRLFHPPLPSLHQCFFRTAKAYSGERKKLSTQQHFSFILMSCFMISTLFSIAFTFFSMLMLVKTKCKLTPTWFEHAAFWSGVRRATIAPRSQLMVTKSDANLYLFLFSEFF